MIMQMEALRGFINNLNHGVKMVELPMSVCVGDAGRASVVFLTLSQCRNNVRLQNKWYSDLMILV